MGFGSSAFGSAAFGGGEDMVGDGIGPVITNVSPTVGAEIGRFENFEFDIGDADGVKIVVITVKISNIEDTLVCYSDGAFLGRFAKLSVYTANTGDVGDPSHFAILPDGGWFGTVEAIKVIALDVHGAQSGIDV